MQTRQHDIMNRLTDMGGAGSVVADGTVNEFSTVTVNDKPAPLFEDSLLSPPQYRYRATVPVTEGTNLLTIAATDQDDETTTQQWTFNVPAVQRSFTYDANGNMLTDSIGRVFTWDGKNCPSLRSRPAKSLRMDDAAIAAKQGLKRVTVGGQNYEWDYDYRDRRVRELVHTSGGSKPTIPAKQFIWHDNDIVQERVGTSATAGTISRNHYYGGFTIGATVSTAAKYQTFTDHLGHVREVVAASGTNPAIGTVLTRYEYSPCQGPTKVYQFPSTNVEATFQTIGRYYHHEPSGLDLALYRAYDAELGRWISEDPLDDAELIEGSNLYWYVANNPKHLFDPDGRGAEGAGWGASIGGFAGGAIGGTLGGVGGAAGGTLVCPGVGTLGGGAAGAVEGAAAGAGIGILAGAAIGSMIEDIACWLKKSKSVVWVCKCKFVGDQKILDQGAPKFSWGEGRTKQEAQAAAHRSVAQWGGSTRYKHCDCWIKQR
jgi:RHS repeat-associated protein